MLDTVVLRVPVNEIQIKDSNRFSPPAQHALTPSYQGNGQLRQCVLNPTKSDKERHG